MPPPLQDEVTSTNTHSVMWLNDILNVVKFQRNLEIYIVTLTLSCVSSLNAFIFLKAVAARAGVRAGNCKGLETKSAWLPS